MAVTIAFQQATDGFISSGTLSGTGVNCGSAAADRIVVVTFGWEGNGSVTSVGFVEGGSTNITGQFVQAVNTTGTDHGVCIAWAPIPTGTTFDFTASIPGVSVFNYFGVWKVTGAGGVSDTDTNTGAGANITLTGVTVPTGGAGIFAWVNNTAGATTWTNATERYDSGDISGTGQHSGADTTTAGTNTITCDGQTADQAIVGIALSIHATLIVPLLTDTPEIYSSLVLQDIWATISQAYVELGTESGGVLQTLLPSLYTDADNFYAPTVTRGVRTLTVPRFDSTPDTFYAPTITRGAKTLTPGLFSDTPDTFYAPTIQRSAKTLTPGLVSDTPDTFYAPTVLRSKTLTPGLVSDTPDTFYAPTVTRGVRTISPARQDDIPDTFYAPTITRGVRTITVPLYSDTPDTFYTPTVLRSKTLTPGLYSDTPDTFYAPTITRGAKALTVPLFSDTPDTFYAPTIQRGARTLTAALYTDADNFYAPRIGRSIAPALYTDADNFYAPSVTRGVRTLTPGQLTDTPDTFYAPSIQRGVRTLTVSLYTDADTLYAPFVYPVQALAPDADIDDGGWTNELDSNVDLFASIDEGAANDSDYIKSSSQPVADIVKLGIANPTPPGASLSQPFKVKYRYNKNANISGAMELKARLMQGAAVIAEWTHPNISASFVDAEQELTELEFNSITDFDDLSVEFEADWAA